MRILAVLLLVMLASSCSPLERQSTTDRAEGKETFASVGDVILRVDVKEDLPNAFGRADIFGRTRDRGFSEIRYMGLTSDGLAVFRRRDVDILTNEDTLNRSGFGSTVVTAQPAGQGVIVTGVGTQAPGANVTALPPDTTQFALDLNAGRIITIRDKRIEILAATPSEVRYMVR